MIAPIEEVKLGANLIVSRSGTGNVQILSVFDGAAVVVDHIDVPAFAELLARWASRNGRARSRIRPDRGAGKP